MEYKWLEEVAKHHKEWVNTIQKMGEFDYAEDIVQESYIALMKYACLLYTSPSPRDS